jgi:predicted nucleic acid-binding protein
VTYVLDSNVALKWVLPEEDSAKALQLRDEARQRIHELLAPDVFPIEVGHALPRAERMGRIAKGAGWALWQTVLSDAPAFFASLPLMPRAFAISSQMRVGVYDCLYIALAEQEKCEFITADGPVLNNLRLQFPFIRPLSTL